MGIPIGGVQASEIPGLKKNQKVMVMNPNASQRLPFFMPLPPLKIDSSTVFG
jgi:hypothetical protein